MSPKLTIGLRRAGVAFAVLAMMAVAVPRSAEAYYGGYNHGYHGYGYRGLHRYGHHGYGHFGGHYGSRLYRGSYHRSSYYYGGSSYSPYYVPAGGFNLSVAQRAGVGALDLRVKPNRAEVYLDGEYIGRAGSYDGYPAVLWLGEGTHRLVFFRDGRKTMASDYIVTAGEVTAVRLTMGRGTSEDPQAFFADPTEIAAGQRRQHQTSTG